jgi:hypothetical protein
MHRLLHGAVNRFSTAYPLGCQPVVLVIAKSDLSAVAQREGGSDEAIQESVGWVERSDTHHVLNDGDGFRERLHPSCASAGLLRGACHRARIRATRWLALTVAATDWIVERNQADLPRPVPSAKIFSFAADPNHFYIPCRLVPKQGRIAIVTDAGRDAVDARVSGAQGNRRAR